MLIVVNHTAVIPSHPDDVPYSCKYCMSSANPSDFEVVHIQLNVSKVVLRVYLLSRCKSCLRFLNAKQDMSDFEFYKSIV